MSALALIPPETVIPDGIEPVEALRVWHFEGGKLCSLNGVEWKPMKPLEATCRADAVEQYSWSVVRGGMTREEAVSRREQSIQRRHEAITMWWGGPTPRASALIPEPFSGALPPGYGFQLDTVTHAAPHEDCTCGIYAAETEEQLPSGTVYGKAKLWGKIVPGERGVRAQYAYPSEFEVSADLLDNPALKAFGVPIKLNEREPVNATHVGLMSFASPITSSGASWSFSEPPKPKWPKAIILAITVNLACAAWNLTVGLTH